MGEREGWQTGGMEVRGGGSSLKSTQRKQTRTHLPQVVYLLSGLVFCRFAESPFQLLHE